MNHQVMEESQALALTHAYTSMRDQIHHRNLLNQSADVRDSQFLIEREQVIQAWQQWLG